MSSLTESAKLVGFFSYSREDDKDSKGALSALREAIQSELSMQLGRSPPNFQIWQDKEAIPFGTYWEDRIRAGIGEAVFFVPIITPRVVKSKNCAFEFKAFLDRERALGRADLVFPLLYVRVPELDVEEQWRADPVLSVVGTRQYFDWRAMRYKDPRSPEAGVRIEQFCNNIANALTQPWVAPPQQPGPPELKHEPQQARAACFMGATASEAEGSKQAVPDIGDERADGHGEAPSGGAARHWWSPTRAAMIGSVLLGAIIVAGVWFRVGITRHDDQQNVAVERGTNATPTAPRTANELPPSGAPQNPSAPVPATQSADAAVAPVNSAHSAAATEPLVPIILQKRAEPVRTAAADEPSKPAAPLTVEKRTEPVPPIVVDRWAACRPNAQQRADYIGGSALPVTLKLALTPAQQNAVAVRTVAVSPDGKYVVSAGDDAVVRVWLAENLQFVDQMLGHRGPVFAAAFSSDGRFLATASFDGTVKLWDGRSFTPVQTFVATDEKGPVRQSSVAFVPPSNPQYVYSTGADGNVWVWDLQRRQLARKIRGNPGPETTTAALSVVPKGRYAFATANYDGTVRFFLEDGRVEAANAFAGKVLRLSYAVDGRLAVAGADALGKAPGIAGVKIWDSSRSYARAIPAHRGHAASVAWSRDGTYLATGGGFLDTSVGLWNPQTGEELRSFRGHTADVEAVVFHPNQKWLLSGSEDGAVKIWNIDEGRELLSVVGLPNRDYVAYAPNNCYTGSANAPSYVKFVYKDGKVEHDISARVSDVFVPTTDVLLFR